MALTNPTYLISMSDLQYFEGKLAAKYQTQTISAEGITATSVVGALEELANSIASLPSAIVPKGTKAFSGLAPSTDLAAANVGFMWNISDAFTTTADFVEGAGHSIPAGANVYVANPSANTYKYDIFQGMYDLSGYKTKQTAVVDGDATTSGTGVTFVDSVTQDANGEITVHKKTVADVVASASGSGGSNGLMTAAQAEQLATLVAGFSGKADKDADAVDGNIAEFDANGNPVDSGHALSEYKTKQTAVADSDATTSGNALTFVDSVTQNANGEITVHKKGVLVASTSDIDEIFA